MDIKLHKLDEIIELLKRIDKNTKPKPLMVRELPFDDEETSDVKPDPKLSYVWDGTIHSEDFHWNSLNSDLTIDQHKPNESTD